MLRRKKFLHGYNSNYKYTFKESSNRAGDGLPQTQAWPPEEERPWYYSPVMCEH